MLCEEICSEVMSLLNNGVEARKAAAHAVALLENSPLTNAGLGSNLTLDGKVECDASIIDMKGFGSVGALTNVQNPVMTALSLLEAQSNGHLSFGRIAPLMLVGEGAKTWAIEHNQATVGDTDLITEASLRSHRLSIQKMKEIEELRKLNTSKSESNNEVADLTTTQATLDTVGAIVLDSAGNFASAASSGGILLKHPGRIGHASIYGCGCWVDTIEDDIESESKPQIAICTTGCGEHIMKTIFAKECADYMLNRDNDAKSLSGFMEEKFFRSPKLKVYKEKLVGALIGKLEYDENAKYLEFFAMHTTASMCYGFMTTNMKRPLSIMSRQPESATKDKNRVSITSHRFKMDVVRSIDAVMSDINKSLEVDNTHETGNQTMKKSKHDDD